MKTRTNLVFSSPEEDDPIAQFLRDSFDAAHTPSLKNSSFCYLLTSDGSILFAKGGTQFDDFAPSPLFPSCGPSIGSLQVQFLDKYEMNGVTAVCVTKRVAMMLRNLYISLLKV